MGKHGGAGDYTAGTDTGPAFKDLTAEEKAAEFDADPKGYAARNFGADPDAKRYPLG